MIEAYEYPGEIHRITTEDGYILECHRISAPGKQPVILMHGMLDSSATWVMLGPDKGLGELDLDIYTQEKIVFRCFFNCVLKFIAGYILYNEGYDVWLANARGNVYSQRHIKYNPFGSRSERKIFWNFSWHEASDLFFLIKSKVFPYNACSFCFICI